MALTAQAQVQGLGGGPILPATSLAPTPTPAHPKYWHILGPQVVADIRGGPRIWRGLQVEQEPGGTIDRDIGHHSEGVPGGDRRGLSMAAKETTGPLPLQAATQ